MEGKGPVDFGLSGSGDTIFELSIAGLLSVAKVEAGAIIHDSFSKRRENFDK